MRRFTVYQDPSQWVGKTWWYWTTAGEPQQDDHGPYPFRWLALLSGWLGTR